MRNRRLLIVGVAAVSLVVGVVWAQPESKDKSNGKAQATPTTAAEQQWEYDVIESQMAPDEYRRKLKDAGNNQWELVAVYHKATGSDNFLMFFKRPK